jgi:hypothetical protein
MNSWYLLKKLSLLLLLLIVQIAKPLSAQNKIQFQFRNDHTFKIAQFTDLHWDNNSPQCAATTETIRKVLSSEKPDLAILTGDIVTALPAREGWLAVAKIFADSKIPWAVTLGNHDAEPEITRDQIFELLQSLPWFVGSKGPELYGCGNYSLPVKSSNGKSIASVIYCMDSNDYPIDKKIGNYDWIQYDQVGWYRNTSNQYTAGNNGMPLPSLIFFHIPLMEYKNVVGKETTVGTKNEGVASASLNSGLFASLSEKKDVMGVFVGHDHDNDYISIEHDIALAFGRVTGADAYGDFERGSRIIELHEGEFSFNTWIRTPTKIEYKYNFPSGLLTDDSSVTYLSPLPVKDLKQGVSYKYYEGSYKSTTDIASSKVKKSGILNNISLDQATARDSFAFEFNAFLKIPHKAVYRFYTYSDDGSKLFIDDQEVVNNDGSHSAQRADGKIALEEGYHKFRLIYFENYMGNKLEVGFSSINIRECPIPDKLFFTK